MQNEQLNKALTGKTVKSVDRADDADMGILIHFTDGTRLEMKFCAEYGDIFLNDELADATGSWSTDEPF
jgi:hypothetical protein